MTKQRLLGDELSLLIEKLNPGITSIPQTPKLHSVFVTGNYGPKNPDSGESKAIFELNTNPSENSNTPKTKYFALSISEVVVDKTKTMGEGEDKIELKAHATERKRVPYTIFKNVKPSDYKWVADLIKDSKNYKEVGDDANGRPVIKLKGQALIGNIFTYKTPDFNIYQMIDGKMVPLKSRSRFNPFVPGGEYVKNPPAVTNRRTVFIEEQDLNSASINTILCADMDRNVIPYTVDEQIIITYNLGKIVGQEVKREPIVTGEEQEEDTHMPSAEELAGLTDK